jgi:lipoate-protein ligase A
MEVDGKKISGSAYKLKLGKPNGEGRRSLHHGTMLLNLDLNAL